MRRQPAGGVVRQAIGAVIVATLALLIPVGASAGPRAVDDIYVASYRGDCAASLSVIKNHRVTKSWEPVGGPCMQASAMAVAHRIRTLPARPEFQGAEYTLGRTPTGVIYDYPSTVVMDLPDGTTDRRWNYAGGYFDGTVYRFTRQWTDPVALFTTDLYLGGIAYDRDTDSLWVLDSRADFESGLGVVRNYAFDGTLISQFVVRGGSTPQPIGLAYDARTDTLWISRVRDTDSPIVLETYSTDGQWLGDVRTSLTGIVSGLEFRQRGKG